MIPEFDRLGNLPLGIHDATILEIEIRFGGRGQRRRVFEDLVVWLGHMKAAGCRTVYVNGSFVTAKEFPNDFDACFDPTGVDRAKLDPVLLERSDAAIDLIRARYGGDIRVDREMPPGSISPYLRFFMRDGRARVEKGIVRLDLSKEAP